MYTSNKIKAHNKCLCILEMIQEANNRIGTASANLFTYDQSKWDSFFCLMHSREKLQKDYDKYQAIKSRLVKYYYATLQQVVGTTAA